MVRDRSDFATSNSISIAGSFLSQVNKHKLARRNDTIKSIPLARFITHPLNKYYIDVLFYFCAKVVPIQTQGELKCQLRLK